MLFKSAATAHAFRFRVDRCDECFLKGHGCHRERLNNARDRSKCMSSFEGTTGTARLDLGLQVSDLTDPEAEGAEEREEGNASRSSM